jgi:Holliday junction DNA helicase RuvA
MIASLRGVLRSVSTDHVVIETGGVGFLVYAPRPVLANLGASGDEAFLHTLLLVREDSLTLYGFATLEQRSLFETVLGVSGVGPRVALALLSSATPDEVRMAVARSDAARFARVQGIGKKLAERLVLELKGKLDLRNLPAASDSVPAADPAVAATSATLNDELAALLVSLGYSSSEASAAIAALPADAPANLEERLRLALRSFGSA